MTQSAYSKDTLANILVDKVIADTPQDTVQVRKDKIVFGADGSYTDVTALTPFPVTGTFSGSTGFVNFGQGTPTPILVTDTSTILLVQNLNRKFARVVNNSSERIYLQYEIDAVYGQGVPLMTNGVFTLTNVDLFLGKITAITSTGNAVLIDIIEGVS